MKLLLDENLSPRLVKRLDELFPGTLHVRDLGLQSADDDAVWRHAREQGSCITQKTLIFTSLASCSDRRPR